MNIVETRPPETIANMAIILIKQADYLLYRQLQRLSDDFINNGGFAERMTRLRKTLRTLETLKTLKTLGTLKTLPALSWRNGGNCVNLRLL